MPRGKYLEDLLYFCFSIQLGVNLFESINVQMALSMMQKAYLKDIA